MHLQDIVEIGRYLKETPLRLRTAVMCKVSSAKVLETPSDVAQLLLLHLTADSQIIKLKATPKHQRYLNLDYELCNEIAKFLPEIGKLTTKHLELHGITAENSIVPKIISLCPKLITLYLNGETVEEVLDALQDSCPNLQNLSLDGCWVGDVDIVKALFETNEDIWSLGEAMCNGDDIAQKSRFPSLTNLTVVSPLVSICGATVLLNALRNLNHLNYSYWSTAVGDALLFLKEVVSPKLSVSISSISLWRATAERINSVIDTCPKLQHLLVECVDPSLEDFSALSSLSNLSSLCLRCIPENLIVSAIIAVGSKLKSLEIEYEQYSYKNLSWETIDAINQHCPYLQTLTLSNIELKSQKNTVLYYKWASSLTEVTNLTVKESIIHPDSVERLILGNSSLEKLHLDINKISLTDDFMNKIMKNNNLNRLKQIAFGAGVFSDAGVSKLFALPELRNLTLDLDSLPNVTKDSFTTLQNTLRQGNYLCTLYNSCIKE